MYFLTPDARISIGDKDEQISSHGLGILGLTMVFFLLESPMVGLD